MMTEKSRLTLLQFIIRPLMYMSHADQHTMVAFLQGYELGQGEDRYFSQQLHHYFSRLGISSESDGWPGQIGRYAEREHMTWRSAFQKGALDILLSEAEGGMTEVLREEIRGRIVSFIERINEEGHPWFNPGWIDEWNALCHLESPWFRQLWTEHELDVIHAMALAIQQNKVFQDWETFLPTDELLQLRARFHLRAAAQ